MKKKIKKSCYSCYITKDNMDKCMLCHNYNLWGDKNMAFNPATRKPIEKKQAPGQGSEVEIKHCTLPGHCEIVNDWELLKLIPRGQTRKARIEFID